MIRKYFLVFLALFSFPVFAEDEDISAGIYTINSPTAFTLPRAGFDVSMLAYDRGGMEFKTIVGVHDAIFIGVSLDVDHAVGKEKADANTPGVVAKLKLTDGWESFPISIALGYDSFYIGAYGKVESSGRRFSSRARQDGAFRVRGSVPARRRLRLIAASVAAAASFT